MYSNVPNLNQALYLFRILKIIAIATNIITNNYDKSKKFNIKQWMNE